MDAHFQTKERAITFHCTPDELYISIDVIEGSGVDYSESRTITLTNEEVKELVNFLEKRF